MSYTLTNVSSNTLTIDQFQIAPGAAITVPVLSSNAIVAKNRGLITITAVNSQKDDAALAGVNGNVPNPVESLWILYSALVVPNVQGTLNFDASLASGFVFFLTGNVTQINNPANLTIGQKLTLEFVQDATGSRTVPLKAGWGSKFKFIGGTAPVLSTAANAIDKMECWYDGTNILCSNIEKAFS